MKPKKPREARVTDYDGMNQQEVDALICDGHQWALEHVITTKDDVEEVYHFLKGRMEMEDGEHDHDDDHHEHPMNVEIISDVETEEDDDDGDGEDE
jgi:hypothetical protein